MVETSVTEMAKVDLGGIVDAGQRSFVNNIEDKTNNDNDSINDNNNNNNHHNHNKNISNDNNEDRDEVFRNESNSNNDDSENTNNSNSNNDDSENTNNSNNNNDVDNSYNRFSSASSQLTIGSKKPMISNKKELKQLRKPSDRIQSKSYCATFCYNIPRSSLMITIPGFVILATGAILIAAADRNASWTDGGMLLVSLVFLIVGGFWTLGGLIYWLITWCKYKPDVVKRSQMSSRLAMTASATSSSGLNNGYLSIGNLPLFIAPATSTPTAFETVNSPFTIIPHPIFSQQQLKQSQELDQQQEQQRQQNPSKSEMAQQTSESSSGNIQQETTRQQQNAQQTSQQLQQNLSNHQQNIHKEVSYPVDDVTNFAQHHRQRMTDESHSTQENLHITDYY